MYAIPENCDKSKLPLPEMASQILGWDSSIRYGDVDFPDVVFPGLHMVQDHISPGSPNKINKKNLDMSLFSSNINVFRSIVTSEETQMTSKSNPGEHA